MKKLSLLLTALTAAFSFSSANAEFPYDLDGGVVFIEEGRTPGVGNFIRTFEQTTELTVSFPGTAIEMEYDKKNVWPRASGRIGTTDLSCCVANAWAFIEVDGIWYGGTWEFLRNGQTVKQQSALRGSRHLRDAPLNNYRIRTGDVIGFMVAGITRNGLGFNNHRERSDIKFFKVGTGPISFEEAGFSPEGNALNISPILDLLNE